VVVVVVVMMVVVVVVVVAAVATSKRQPNAALKGTVTAVLVPATALALSIPVQHPLL
jgi:hypothetical protein